MAGMVIVISAMTIAACKKYGRLNEELKFNH